MDIDTMIAHLALLGWEPKDVGRIATFAITNNDTLTCVYLTSSGIISIKYDEGSVLLRWAASTWSTDLVPKFFNYIMEHGL